MQTARSTFILLLFLLSSTFCFSQQKWPNSFLWRISGNGLSKPSYLYGTIHLQDRRLFQFSDSLYRSLENVEGFALEVNFNEFMDSVFSRSISKAESRFLDEKEEIKVDRKKVDKSVDSILRKLKVDLNRLTKKDLKRIRDARMNELVQQGEMTTIVDGYLFGLAQRLDKWTGGIEDVVDQLDLSDELGANLTPEEVFQSEANLKSGLQEMIKIYINRDLEAVANYVDGSYPNSFKDEILTHRNVKMARRMDSLTSIRTMFFAVGVAHLPGDSGVINLLRKRGFTVEPVFSLQTMTPESYSSRLNNIPWKKVESDSLYRVEMPGNPTDYDVLGQVAKMKIFFDLPTMTFYMSGHTIAASSNSTNLDDALGNIADRFGISQKKLKTKDVSQGEVKGKEVSIENQGMYYTIRLLQKKSIMYLLMAGSEKKTERVNADIEKFFSSFSVREIAVMNREWKDFSIEEKGFKIKMPGSPRRNLAVDKRAEGSNWRFFTYDYADNDKGLYYLLQVREMKEGYFLEGDTSYFELYKESMIGAFKKMLSEERFVLQGWPACRMDFLYQSEGIYRIYTVIRGSRVYILLAGGNKNADLSDVDQMFHSLTLQDPPPVTWKNYRSEGFSTMAPGPFVKGTNDSTDNEQEHFLAFDSLNVVSYEVFKYPISPYYWIKNDSLYFEQKITAFRRYNDSLLEKHFTYNGNLKAIDFVRQKKANYMLRRTRILVSGDTLYTLITVAPSAYLKNENLDNFFTNFRVTHETDPTIYSNKSEKLLEALKTKDSAEFAKRYSVFEQVEFGESDRRLLQDALLNNYWASKNNFRTLNEQIVDILATMADDSTIEFVHKNYEKLNGDKEALKYDLLNLLAKIKTSESYSVLKKLILESPPMRGNNRNLSYSLRDSLLLTKILYPEILKLSTDSILTELLVDVTNNMIDSSVVSMQDVLLYKQNFIKQARKNLQLISKDEDEWWKYTNWIKFLGKMNDGETNQLLSEFLKLKSIDIKYNAIVELARNDRPVNAIDIEKVSGDKSYRKELYDEFKKMGKLKLFPAKYATQLKIAESEIFEIATSDEDEAEFDGLTFLEERTAEFMGKEQKFYLFRISFKGEENSTSYLGITGPYISGTKEIITSSKASAVFWDEAFDKSKITDQFKKLLLQQEDYLKESPVEEK